MIVLITGSKGFIGSSLVARLKKENGIRVLEFDKDDTDEYLFECLEVADFIYHFAAVQRPIDLDYSTNISLSSKILAFLQERNKKTPLFFSSSIQAELNNPYGLCKRKEEKLFLDYSAFNKSTVYICRFSNIFGPRSRPNYTSVVSTFIYNVINNFPVTINNTDTTLNLLYIDDVISYLFQLLKIPSFDASIIQLDCYYSVSLVNLLCLINAIKQKDEQIMSCFDSAFVERIKTTYSFFQNEYKD